MRKTLSIFALAAVSMLGTACTQAERNRTEAAAERAGDRAEAAAERAGDSAARTADRAEHAMDNAGMTAKVKTKLAADVRLSTLTSINVDSNGGVVTLSGTVPTAEDKRMAESVAKSAEGVQSVVNNLTVSGR